MGEGALRIGVIGGGGWLGGAIVQRILDAGLVSPADLALSWRRGRPDRFQGAFWTRDNQELADRSDVIVVSVRPQDWPALDLDAKGKLVISVMAGIRLADLAAGLGTARVVRALPNAAAEVGMSYTPWVAAPEVGKADRATVMRIFDTCGLTDDVADEAALDYLTGLTGTGPAYPALLAAAMMEDAIARGLRPEIARRAVNALLIGAGRLLERGDASPADTVETFLSYRGVTAAGIEAMRAAGFETAVRAGLAAAAQKSEAMALASSALKNPS